MMMIFKVKSWMDSEDHKKYEDQGDDEEDYGD